MNVLIPKNSVNFHSAYSRQTDLPAAPINAPVHQRRSWLEAMEAGRKLEC